MIAREEEFPAKQEDETNGVKAPSSSKSWLGLKDSRIVRVSRTFGGKDRHSKVFTVRGLRDRRVRLSVQTAIQLYDLQDRLGLNQPSKAVDWLLNVAQREIDLLPPLQIPSENFLRSQTSGPSSQSPFTSRSGGDVGNVRSGNNPHSLGLSSSAENVESFHDEENQGVLPKPSFWGPNSNLRAKDKGVSDWYKRNEQEKQEASEIDGSQDDQLPFDYNSHKPSHSNFSSNYCPLEVPSNLVYQSPVGNTYNSSSITTPIQQSLLQQYNNPQLLIYPCHETIPSYFPSYIGPSLEHQPKQINHFQVLSSVSQNPLQANVSNPSSASLHSISPSIRPFQVSNMAPKKSSYSK